MLLPPLLLLPVCLSVTHCLVQHHLRLCVATPDPPSRCAFLEDCYGCSAAVAQLLWPVHCASLASNLSLQPTCIIDAGHTCKAVLTAVTAGVFGERYMTWWIVLSIIWCVHAVCAAACRASSPLDRGAIGQL